MMSLGRVVIGDDNIAFHRRAEDARIVDFKLDAMRGGRKRALRITVTERAVVHDVRLASRMQQRRIGAQCGARIDLDRQRSILDENRIERIFGEVAIARHDHRDRLADIAHPIDRQRPIVDRCLHADDEGFGHRLYFGAGEHRCDAWARERVARIDRQNHRVRMGRAQNGGVERATTRCHVVAEEGRAGEQG